MKILSIIQAKNPAFYSSIQDLLGRMQHAESYSAKAIAQYAGLLFLLSQNPGLVVVPTDAIDDVLHQHMEQPEFAQDMALLFGDRAVAAHLPGSSEASFAATKVLFENEFRVVYGGSAAACELFIKGGDRPA